MTDGWTALTAAAAAIGTLAAIASTIASLRSSSARKHVARAHDAAELIRDLDSLPADHATGPRLTTGHNDKDLRSELARIVRENAAGYASRNPTPVGADVLRLLVPLYGIFFMALGVVALISSGSAASHAEWVESGVTALFFFVAALFFVSATALLWWRLSQRNASRALAGTPGSETYLVTPGEIAGLYRSIRARRRTRRTG